MTPMDEQVMTFRMATIGRRGMVIFSPEGMDILRAWLIHFIEECSRSADRAERNPNPADPSWSKEQVRYYKAARAYMTHMLCSRVKERINLRTEMSILTQWHKEYDIPPGWAEAVQLASEMEEGDATGGSTPSGGGAGSGGGGGQLGLDEGLLGSIPAYASDAEPPPIDTGSCGGPAGTPAVGAGDEPAGKSRGRGGHRDKKSRTGKQGTRKAAKAVGNTTDAWISTRPTGSIHVHDSRGDVQHGDGSAGEIHSSGGE